MDWLSKFNENSEKVIWVRIHMNLRGWEPFRVNVQDEPRLRWTKSLLFNTEPRRTGS